MMIINCFGGTLLLFFSVMAVAKIQVDMWMRIQYVYQVVAVRLFKYIPRCQLFKQCDVPAIHPLLHVTVLIYYTMW